MNDIASPQAVELKKSLLPLVQIVGHNLKWSSIERKGTLGRLYAMYHFFSLPFIFGTISPSMRDSRLAIRMCYTSADKEVVELPPVHTRTKMITDDPVAAAQVFDRVMRAFFSVIAGIPLSHFTGKRANVDRLLYSTRGDYVGVFGRLHAAHGVIEAQSSSSLHTHFHLWGHLDHKVVGQWVHDGEFRKQITKSIDDIVTARMPSHVVDEEKAKKGVVIGAEPYPDAEHLDADSAHVRYYLNSHRHTFTCWKHNSHTCRICTPRQLIPDTYIAQLIPNPALKPKLVPLRLVDDISGGDAIAPPPLDSLNRPIDQEECRVLGFGLGRSTNIEQMQVETNKVTSSLLRCNTSMQPLITPSQAKAAMFYTSKYCSKDPFELSSTLSFFHQAQLAMRKYGSTATDAGSASRNAKCILQKVLNKIGHIEVSCQQATDSLIGNDYFFSSHKFRFVFI